MAKHTNLLTHGFRNGPPQKLSKKREALPGTGIHLGVMVGIRGCRCVNQERND